MSFRREVAKTILTRLVEEVASDIATQLRGAARREPAGLLRDLERSVADLADDASEDPSWVLALVESLYDYKRRESGDYSVRWRS